MLHTKKSAKRKRRRTAVPVLGAAGLLSLATGASAAPAANMPARSADVSHEFILAEEEISDVSLATFYVFDKELVGSFRPNVLLARGGCGGCGCRGCGGCGGFRGCGGCGCSFRGCSGCVGFRGCGGCIACVGCAVGWWGGCYGGCCLSGGWGGCNFC